MFWKVWEFWVVGIESFLFFLLMNRKLELRKCTGIRGTESLVWMIYSIGLWILNQRQMSTVVTVFYALVLHFVITCVFTKSPLFLQFFYVILYSTYALLADVVSAMLPVVLFHENINQVLSGGGIRAVFTLVYLILLGVLIGLTIMIGKQNICLRTKEKLIFIGIALLCVTIEQIDMIAVVRALQQSRGNDFFMLVTIFVFVLFLFMIMLLFIYNLGVEREKNNKLLEENLLSHMESQQYEQILASVKELRIMKHDVKNHLDVLQTLLVGNHTGQAVDYMRQITADLNKVHYTLSSGNTTVDCIVSNKQSMAENVGILTENIIYLPEEIPLSDVEICSLLGNLYDNAIEGCMRAESKRIWLYMKPFHNMLSIKIVNTSDGGYRFNSRNELLSTKAGKGNQNGMEHGIGLKRIREIVERHFGIMEILPEKEMFSVNILIPLHQGEQQT